TDAGAALTVLLTDTPETLAVYPFHFEVRLTYLWAGSTLTVDQEYRNTSDEVMPFSYGFHPYFAAPDKSALAFDLPTAAYFDRANDVNATWPDAQWDFNLDEIDAAFAALPNDKPITTAVSDRAQNFKLTMTTGGDSRHLVFWTMKGKPFYCLEPWSGPRNSIGTGTNLTLLSPGEAHCDRLVLQWERLGAS
ncbi:MAG: aldose epimerase, partial [Cyanobacteria bacterium J06648_11]